MQPPCICTLQVPGTRPSGVEPLSRLCVCSLQVAALGAPSLWHWWLLHTHLGPGVRSPLNLLGRFRSWALGCAVLDLVALRPATWNTSSRTRASRESTRSLQRSDKASARNARGGGGMRRTASALRYRSPWVATATGHGWMLTT